MGALAQSSSKTLDVRRVGSRLACQCGCKDSVATCSMLECSFSKPARERIARMMAAGFSDDQIIQAFVSDYGPGIYLAPPSAFGWIIPYASLGVGLLVIWAFIRHYLKPKAVTEAGEAEIEDPNLARYKSQIEKELEKLD
jgi:cytochrome c-type biogenesis protein CcmH